MVWGDRYFPAVFPLRYMTTLRSHAPFQVAIDGPAASGKSTVARLLADRLGGYYVNTGELYRAITLHALRNGVCAESDPEGVVALLVGLALRYALDSDGAVRLHMEGEPIAQEEIRSPEVAAQVSYVARIPGVRDWLIERQRETRVLGIVVMEGRDIGTVVFPEARYKFFLNASARERARRRLHQAGETAAGATLDSVAAEIEARDRIDASRAVAPLRPADDAVIVGTDPYTAEQVADLLAARILNRESIPERPVPS